jgi:hypothetical protein
VTRGSLVIAAVALVWTIHATGLATLWTNFQKIGWWWLAVVPIEAVITTLDALAIRAFLSPDRVKLRTAVLAQLSGRAVNAVAPTGSLGEAIKVSVLTEHVSQSRAVATILLYNVVGFTVELATVAVAAPFMALLLPMPSSVRWLMIISAIVCAAISFGLYALVRRGMLASVTGLAVRLRILSKARYERWRERLSAVDDKVRVTTGARTRDRVFGIALVTISRLTSMTLSLLLLHAMGGAITVAFVAAYTVGGFVIYMVGSMVPMGIGVSEGGNLELFKLLGADWRAGVTLVEARRTTLVVYAAIGLVLLTASETVKRARQRSVAKHVHAVPVAAPEPPPPPLVDAA